ncbi:MAG TPA: hypothetical protein P5205_10880 [Candidatus Paceibacterota bacterium]|nr:hypothetical protein [Verrucomicrobiota bacterium]HSA10860.1 hypothetical protein [Candidatus Paceibacterota bacterium]
MYVPLRTQLTKEVPWFFEPCFEHLEYLSRDRGFSWNGEIHGGPDAYARMTFEDERLDIRVWLWLPMNLPELEVVSLRKKRRVLELSVIVPEFTLASERGDYYERYKRVHPLDKGGRAEVERLFEVAVANRIGQFGVFLREHLDKLRKAA